MMGVRYIQAVSKTWYISATSGKNTASEEINNPNPSVKAVNNKMEMGKKSIDK